MQPCRALTLSITKMSNPMNVSLEDSVPRRKTINPDEYEPDYEDSTHIEREANAQRTPNNTGFSYPGAKRALAQEVSERANIAHS